MKTQKPIYESFSISLMDNNWNTNSDKDGKLLPNKELVPMMLENKLCKWLNKNNQKYAVSLDGSYIEIEGGK